MEPRDFSPEITAVAQNYQYHSTPAQLANLQDFLTRAYRAIREALRLLLEHRVEGSADSSTVSAFLQLAIYLVGVIGVGFLIYYLYKRLSREGDAVKQKKGGIVFVEEILSADGWAKQASALAQAQDYRGACRALYLFLLQYMDEQGLAVFAPAKTNYEYGYILSNYPEIRSSFRSVADNVEQIWFGNRSASLEDYQANLQEIDRIKPEIARAGAEKKAREAAIV